MANVKQFTEEDLNQEGKILVKFGAPWCGPCRMLAPIIESVSAEGYNVYDVNTDESEDLAIKYQIRSVPTSIVFENGKEVDRVIGAMTAQKIKELLD